MTIYLLCLTPSEVRKLQLVLRLSASVVPCIDLLLGIVPIVRFLMIGMAPRLGTRPDVWPSSTSNPHEKHAFMLLLEYIGAALHAATMPPGAPGTKAGTMLLPIPPWRAVQSANGVCGVQCPPGTIAGAPPPRPSPGLLPPRAVPPGWKLPMVGMLKWVRGGFCTAGGLRVVFTSFVASSPADCCSVG